MSIPDSQAYANMTEHACRRNEWHADMMRKQIVMPAHFMNDLEHPEKNEGRNLFADFSDIAQRLEVRRRFWLLSQWARSAAQSLRLVISDVHRQTAAGCEKEPVFLASAILGAAHR